jgi:hypothetical protein
MQAGPWVGYSSYFAIPGTGSTTTPVTCRALYVAAGGTVTVAPTVGGTQVTFATIPVGGILPVELNEGIVAVCPAGTVALQ